MIKLEIHKSVCRICHGGCGVLVHVSDGKVTKIEGDKENPINKGRLCAKGLASLELLYHPDRLKHPLKKVKEGTWDRISWDEALSIISDELARIRKQYGPESVAVFQGTGRHHYLFVPRFAHAFGTPNWSEPGLAQCFFPRLTVATITFGEYLVNDYYNKDVNPKCILVWGHNPIITGPDGELPWPFLEALDKGSKLIVIDPRLTITAQRADIWIQLRPGTDCALALAMLNVIIQEELYDKDFVEKWVYGFDRLVEHVKKFTPEWAEEITWIEKQKIKETAREFAENKPACVEWGVAIEHTPNSIQTLRAVMLLPAITGNIDIPGGLKFGRRIWSNIPTLENTLPEETKRKRLGYDRFKLLSSEHAILPSGHIPSILRAMRTGKPYPIKGLLLFGNNGLVSFANSREVYDSLKKLEFIAAADLFMTPTAELADVVLPAASWLEVDAVMGLPYNAERFLCAQKKIVRIGECKQDEEILIELARKLNLKVGTEALEEVYDRQLIPAGCTWKELKEKNFVLLPTEYKKYEKEGFKTPSGKVEVYSNKLEQLGYYPLPTYKEPPESPISTPEIAKKYPLILITGGRTTVFFHSELRQIKSLRKVHPDPLVEIHPKTAEERGIKDGEWVFIENVRGKIKQKAKLTEGIHPKVVNCEHAWWFPEKGRPEYGVWESNVNLLTSNKPPYDPAMGTYQLRALLCEVYPAG